MVATAKTVILAVDHTKFNKLSAARLYDFTSIDIVVTDLKPPKEWVGFFDNNGVKCIFDE